MNQNTKLLLIVLLAVAVVVTGLGITFPRPLPTQIIEKITQQFGSTGTDVSGCFTINGVTTCAQRMVLSTATTTPCRLRSPLNASSTLIGGGVQFAIASTTQALQVSVARSNNEFSTTSGSIAFRPLATSTISADTTGNNIDFMATNTRPTANENLTALIANDRVFGPGEFIVVGLAGGQHPTPARPTGFCQAEWQVLGTP